MKQNSNSIGSYEDASVGRVGNVTISNDRRVHIQQSSRASRTLSDFNDTRHDFQQ